jgi:superfamily I DNA/RNA helicase
MPPGRGIAFLSFTQAAVFELDTRLRQEGILTSPVFPSFIGTFDSFVWQVLVMPFGIEGTDARPRLIADIGSIQLAPFKGAHPLPLSCFDEFTGNIRPDAAKLRGFDVSQRSTHQVQAYETSAANVRAGLRERGYLGFDQARSAALERLRDPVVAARLAIALASRFVEVIVDEAQDCNPDDLEFVSWLRRSGLPVKIVCDPHQSIYEFRGGVTDHLINFAKTFSVEERKKLTGNFRSSPNICKAIAQFRPVASRGVSDDSLGRHKEEGGPVQVLSYAGKGVPESIGSTFRALLQKSDISTSDSPILAATRASGAAAVGQSLAKGRRDRTVRLAEAVTEFHSAARPADMKTALDSVHEIVLELEGHLDDTTYQQYLSDSEIEPVSWRPKVIALVRELRFDPTKHKDAKAWHTAAKEIVEKRVTISVCQSVSQKLKWSAGIETALAAVSGYSVMSRTIHSVKGTEFPAVCVVTTAPTLKRVLDYLETGKPEKSAEEARKLYVAASRAEKLLVFAAPESQAKRLADHLGAQGANVLVSAI